MSSSSAVTRLFKAIEKEKERLKKEKGRLKKEKERLEKENERLEKENKKLLATATRTDSLFIAEPGTLLKAGHYKILRKLAQDHCSSTFLVEDLEIPKQRRKYLAVKILSADATQVNGYTHELEILLKVSEREVGYLEPPLPVLRDHFAQEGPHGLHYCFVSRSLRTNVNEFRASAPTGRLGVHFVKPIVACTVEALQRLHSRNIIHADIKADNVLFVGAETPQIEETIARDPTLYNDVYTFNGTEYSTLKTQPLRPVLSWDAAPFYAETTQVVLSGLGTALWADRPNPPGNIGTFELRAPENIIGAQCGREIDIWAIGCMTYELLTGQTLFRPQPIQGLTAHESLLLLQYSITGQTLSEDVINKSRLRNKFFNNESFLNHLKENIYPPQSIKERLIELCSDDLNEVQINAAARFINDCLRLNPQYRPTVDELDMHSWLSTAFMGGMDEDQV